MPPLDLPAAPADPEGLARYRWWLGHQLSFFVWRLLSEALGSIADLEQRSAAAAQHAARLFDAYSVLLFYAGSCSPEIYHRVLRPEMAAAHPAFSGRWARDHERIPLLMRTLRKVRSAASISDLIAAERTNHLVHHAVGKRLVPDGPSLLREHTQVRDHLFGDAERDVFDAFFLVERGDISGRTFETQMSELTSAVTADLAETPLTVHRGCSAAAAALCGNAKEAMSRALSPVELSGRTSA